MVIKCKKQSNTLAFINYCWRFLFLGSQAWEWGHFISGDKGVLLLKQFVVHIASENYLLYIN